MTDVVDAMMLSQFFGELWRQGVVVVATSNRPPRNLYEGRLNRGYFLPFVVHHLGDASIGKNRSEGKDYRRIRSRVDVLGSDKCGDYFYLTREGKEEYTAQKLDQPFTSCEQRLSTTHTPSPISKNNIYLSVSFKHHCLFDV